MTSTRIPIIGLESLDQVEWISREETSEDQGFTLACFQDNGFNDVQYNRFMILYVQAIAWKTNQTNKIREFEGSQR